MPEPKAKDRNLEVIEVYGPEECVGGRAADWGVSVLNPEPVTSQTFAATIGLLDPETNTIIRQWNSSALEGLGPFGAAGAIAVPDVRLRSGENRLVVSAGFHNATAAEVTINCRQPTAGESVVIDEIELPPTSTPRRGGGLP